MNETELIIELIKELKAEPMPEQISSCLKACLLDYIGVALAGSHELKEKISAFLDKMPDGSCASPVIGIDRSTSMENAALLNGISAHYYDLDDGSRFGMIHLGAPIFSTLISLSNHAFNDASLFLRAALVGYEVALRLSSAMQPGHKKKGLHATGTCGCIGAAAAASVALDLDEESIKNTIAAAAASASGLLEMIEDVSQLKPFNAGKAAQNAVTAALIGASGFCGPHDPIGGKRGFLKVLSDSFNPEFFNREGDKKYSILGIYRKPYASCRHCHSSVEAALELGQGIEPENIESIHVSTYSLAVFGHDHTDIPSVGAAKMSIPYSVASAICLGTAGMEAMSEEAISDPAIISLTKRVSVSEEPEFSALVPGKRIAELEITLKNSEKLSKRVIYPKGEPENPMSRDELELKFRQLAQHARKNKQYCSEIIELVDSIDTDCGSIKKLIKML